MPDRPARVALYSHDALGLGHLRRNLAVAAAVRAADSAPDVLLLSGAPEASALHRPPGCDLVTLPALQKHADGHYAPRHLSVELDDLTGFRRELLGTALTEFAPDVLVVDRHPHGFRGELTPALAALNGHTHVVLGLRDVLDDPAASRREWDRRQAADALRRWYDEAWVYGDPRIHDPVRAAGLEVPVPVHHTGFLAEGRPRSWSGDDLQLADHPTVVCLVGGGSDGDRLARAFVSAALPDGVRGLVVTGPQMAEHERRAVEQLAAHRPELTVRDFVPDAAALLDDAAAVVTMGGSNTVTELLATDTPALVVPRCSPRDEQRVRAEGLAAHGHVDILLPDAAVPDALAAWIATAVSGGPHPRRGVDLDGLRWVTRRTSELTTPTPSPTPAPHPAPTPAPHPAPALAAAPAPARSATPTADREVPRVAV